MCSARYRALMFVWAALSSIIGTARAQTVAGGRTSDPTAEARAVFERRILPLLEAPRASSCTACHLSGVELKDYIDRDPAKMFASLRAGGMIDLEKPADSKILKFIARKPAESSLISDAVREEEYAAFKAWIEAATADPQLRDARPGDKTLGPALPLEIVRHARRDRVLASFIDNVWSDVGRCAACHSPEKNQAQVRKHGEFISWIKPGDPAATMQHLLEHELIDTASPEKSLLLLKPTNQVKHGGGVKMMVGDKGYKQFRKFVDDYAAVVAGSYRSADELPQPGVELSQVTDSWFRITDLPAFCDEKLVQVDLYREDRTAPGGWSAWRTATGDRMANKGAWQQHLETTLPRDAAGAAEFLQSPPRIPPGRYLVKVYCDRENRLGRDFRYVLGERELIGTFEVDSSWPAGYGRMTVAKFRAAEQ